MPSPPFAPLAVPIRCGARRPPLRRRRRHRRQQHTTPLCLPPPLLVPCHHRASGRINTVPRLCCIPWLQHLRKPLQLLQLPSMRHPSRRSWLQWQRPVPAACAGLITHTTAPAATATSKGRGGFTWFWKNSCRKKKPPKSRTPYGTSPASSPTPANGAQVSAMLRYTLYIAKSVGAFARGCAGCVVERSKKSLHWRCARHGARSIGAGNVVRMNSRRAALCAPRCCFGAAHGWPRWGVRQASFFFLFSPISPPPPGPCRRPSC